MRTITIGYENRKIAHGAFTAGGKKSRIPITITIEEFPGKLLAVESASYYVGTDTQYYYVSPRCLNSFWCHLLAGDPGATSRAVYQPYTQIVIQGKDSTYGAQTTQFSPIAFPSTAVTYGVYGSTLYLFNGEKAYPLTITGQMANPQ